MEERKALRVEKTRAERLRGWIDAFEALPEDEQRRTHHKHVFDLEEHAAITTVVIPMLERACAAAPDEIENRQAFDLLSLLVEAADVYLQASTPAKRSIALAALEDVLAKARTFVDDDGEA